MLNLKLEYLVKCMILLASDSFRISILLLVKLKMEEVIHVVKEYKLFLLMNY